MQTSDDSRPDTDYSRAPTAQQHCNVGARSIPVVMEDRLGTPASATLRWFSDSEKVAREARGFAFWSVLAGPVPLLVFRVESGRPMESGLRVHGRMTPRQVEVLQTFADCVMPATDREVELWLESHPAEASSLVSDVR